ncbi:HLA class II histocompatibility antigen, DR alpha chain-like [Eublepharis macularius]|uniref:HLA class II histocompatibility antigen, DR alpha chain-like n=1 Tax=Eublepharis macularius TaxID=481883 RepID=A0AA97KYB7_EUBMA|nr:HLA class II histocompatibility antigen, DR alpha chain-like [Eublepharis macularius]
MAAGLGGLAGCLWLLLLPLLGGHLVPAEEVLSLLTVVQRGLAPEMWLSEFVASFEGHEIFHVDREQKTVWRLPQFQELTSFQAEGTYQYTFALLSNIDILMRRSNYTPARNVPPKVMVYPERPVVQGEPNVLICLADEFSPPMIRFTWLKNGWKAMADVQETVFYPTVDNAFRKFFYLPFIPDAEDIYYCRVEHPGLAQPLTKEWRANVTESFPETGETGENIACGLGLAVSFVGIVLGTVLIIKSPQKN